eukprot:TRINITY_DN15760_c0_g1_i3.p1 TRINITY_DN15760_c0_g1~~TRINITY_DN15760_c0_g1_i3.p1  ORF type:complete len:124 (-),score=24.37 TRINITY_DN15760_c0_g1_i3:28-399(-)
MCIRDSPISEDGHAMNSMTMAAMIHAFQLNAGAVTDEPNQAGEGGAWLSTMRTESAHICFCREGAVLCAVPVSYTHLRAHETPEHLVCRLLLEKKKYTKTLIGHLKVTSSLHIQRTQNIFEEL